MDLREVKIIGLEGSCGGRILKGLAALDEEIWASRLMGPELLSEICWVLEFSGLGKRLASKESLIGWLLLVRSTSICVWLWLRKKGFVVLLLEEKGTICFEFKKFFP